MQGTRREIGQAPPLAHHGAVDTFIDAPVTRAQVASGVWVRTEHAARALRCDERTIRRRVRSGHFARTVVAGRVYVRQAVPLEQAPEPESAAVEQLAHALVVVREQRAQLEQLAHALGHARATVEQLERARLADAATVLDARRALEREQATAALLVRELAQAREQAAREQARAAHLEQLARAPWYAVRVRRRLRRELATGTA